MKKCTSNFIDFYIDFGRHFSSLGRPFSSQNRSKNRSRPPLEHREPPGACPGASGPSKVTKNGARSEPRTLKIDHFDVPRLPKRSPRAPNMESQRTLDFQKWSLAQGTQNDPKMNQASSQTNPKFETELDATWNQPGTYFNSLIRPHVWITQKKGGGGVSP